MSARSIALLGNPNCGKTTLFNALTGTRQMVGNWPGVTVEKKVGSFSHAGRSYELIDLPGTYSLGSGHAVSIDERIARDYALSGAAQLVVNIVDASNLERNLYLTVQLIEMGLPLVLALNMTDVAKAQRIAIDTAALSRRLGCPVVPMVAAQGQGVEALKDAISHAVDLGAGPALPLHYPPEIEAAVAELLPQVQDAAARRTARWIALELLEGDATLGARLPALAGNVARLRGSVEEALGYDADTAIASARYDLVAEIAGETVQRGAQLDRSLSDRIDRVVLNRGLGIPLFLVIMYLMFLFTINIGGAFIDFFDLAGGTLFVEGTAHLLQRLGSPDWLTTLLADGVGGGLQTVGTFVPVIACLFLFLSVLEDSGYMARAAFVMDRFMRLVGLPGKSFVPLIVGFGCNVPAIMATRTLENQRDRTLTIMMTPFMSCGARLPVYALFAAAFFPTGGQNLVFGLYLIGILAAVLTGLVLKYSLLPGETSPFVMELPPYHLPTLRGVLLRSWDRLKGFVLKAGRIVVAVVVVLAFLNSWGRDGSFGNEDSNKSMLSEIGRTIVPVFEPMGIRPENWPATVGIFTGILAKEAVVGTLNALYAGMAAPEAGAEPAPFDLMAGLSEAAATVPANLAALAGALTDPLGLDLGDVSSPAVAAEAQGVDAGIFGAMASLFDGRAGAFAYLLMVLLYMPCSAAIAAVWRETDWRWTGFVSAWTLLMGYGSAVVFYQAATLARHPASSALWIAAVLGAFAVTVLALRRIGGAKPLPLAVGG
jgi:ferrous iron transport protein B